MQTYVRNAIEAARSKKGRVIHNQDLKAIVAADMGRDPDWSIGTPKWSIADAPLKDEPMDEGHAFIPYRQFWWYDPAIHILMGWVEETLKRIEREVYRMCDALRLPRYARTKQAKEALPRLLELQSAIAKTIEAIEYHS